MGALELSFFAIGVTIALVGLARGYKKELGSTTIVLVAIFLLTFFETQITDLIANLATTIFGVTDPVQVQQWVGSFFTIVFVAIVFAGYAGKTLHFQGVEAPAPQGTILSGIVGVLNGYLIAGTLWYYQANFDYPVSRFFSVDANAMTDLGEELINYLPPALFDNPVFWVIPVAVLLLLRVRG